MYLEFLEPTMRIWTIYLLDVWNFSVIIVFRYIECEVLRLKE